MQLSKRKLTTLIMIGMASLTLLLAAFPQAKAETTLLNEQFDYPDGYSVANLPTRPTPYSLIYTSPSIWSIRSGQLWCDNRPLGFYSFIELGDRSWVNYRVSMKFRLAGVDPAKPNNYAVILHFRKPAVSYGDRLDLQLVGPSGGNVWKIVAEKGGSWYDYRIGGQLPTRVWDGNFHTAEVEANGLNYRIFIDGINVGQFSEPKIGTITHASGSVGLANQGSLVAFDDLIVTTLGPPPTTGTLSVDTTPVKGEVFVNGSTWGIAPQSREMPPGVYTVSFGSVTGYLTPNSQIAEVRLGMTTNVVGKYSLIGRYQLNLIVRSDQDDVSTGTDPTTGSTFFNYVGYSFNMFVRPDRYIKGGYRFTNVGIPKSAKIESSKLRLNLYYSGPISGTTSQPLPAGEWVLVYGQASGNAPPFVKNVTEFLGRPQTNATVTWNLPAGTVAGEWMEVDITPLVQEIINRSDWTQGNAIAIFTDQTIIDPTWNLSKVYGCTSGYPEQLSVTYTYP